MNKAKDNTLPLRLGIDTGGTYTDAALIDSDNKVVNVAKALTTNEDLSAGIGAAIDAVLAKGGCATADIATVALSTTLATNSIVERKWDRVVLVAAGFEHLDLDRERLREALSGDPVVMIRGGHDHHGTEIEPPDLDGVVGQVKGLGPAVSALAVVSRFATRNPEHEVRIRDCLREATGKPVTCSHELSSRLNGPRRAVTAVLNARLVGIIDKLVNAAESLLAHRGIKAPLMIVRGDGSLISAEQAKAKPVETILSGPAASVVAASWFTGKHDAIVADIGGTTTDVAALQDGRPGIDPDGADVGGFRTMVEAVAVRTTGLGGDSETMLREDGTRLRLALGPRRAIPVSLLARDSRELVHGLMDRQLEKDQPDEHAGRFVLPVPGAAGDRRELNRTELKVLVRVGRRVSELSAAVRTRKDLAIVDRLISQGYLRLSCVTPSDAWHVAGIQNTWDAAAARKALELLARRVGPGGRPFAESAHRAAEQVLARLTDQSATFLMECAFAWDERDFGLPPDRLASHALTIAGLDHHRGHIRIEAGLDKQLVALGGPAATCYPEVGNRLSVSVDVPEFSHAANAIGAIVGHVAVRARGHVTTLGKGQFRLHSAIGMEEAATEEKALELLEFRLTEQACRAAAESGILEPVIRVEKDLARSGAESEDDLLQADLVVEATGRPGVKGRVS